MILSDTDIVRRLHYTNSDDRTLTVEPLDDAQIQPASIDLRLAPEFMDPVDGSYWRATDSITLDPGQCLLGSTAERVELPPDIVGQVTGRSTLGRKFVIVHATAGYIDPGWPGPDPEDDGYITLELANLSPVPQEIEIGSRVGQIVLHKTCSESSGYEGQYSGDGVEGAGEL